MRILLCLLVLVVGQASGQTLPDTKGEAERQRARLAKAMPAARSSAVLYFCGREAVAEKALQRAVARLTVNMSASPEELATFLDDVVALSQYAEAYHDALVWANSQSLEIPRARICAKVDAIEEETKGTGQGGPWEKYQGKEPKN